MKFGRWTIAAICGAYITLLGVTHADVATITYNINVSAGPNSIQGTISTDGTIGLLQASHLLDWDLTIENGSGSARLTFINGSAVGSLLASATDLRFPFTGTAGFLFGIGNLFFTEQFLMVDASDVPPNGLLSIVANGNGVGSGGVPISEIIGTVATTPVPAALHCSTPA